MAAGFLALGDSYTIGEGVGRDGCWPVQLARQLRGAGIDIADPQIIARTGWTAAELAGALDATNPAPRWTLVTLAVGVNDQYRGGAVEAYGRELDALLTRAVALAGGMATSVIVLSIPDWGLTPFAARAGRDAAQVALEIDAFNRVAAALAQQHGVRWMDVTTISRLPAVRAEVAADGLHPSAAQYARWVDAIAPVARVALRECVLR